MGILLFPLVPDIFCWQPCLLEDVEDFQVFCIKLHPSLAEGHVSVSFQGGVRWFLIKEVGENPFEPEAALVRILL